MLNNTQALTIEFANYILEHKTTIRATAKAFNTPKSTVHHYLNAKLKYINYNLFIQVKRQLTINFTTKHIHGGEATRLKYTALKKEVNANDKAEFTI